MIIECLLPKLPLLTKELGRSDAGHSLEEAGEVVRELEAKEEGGFADIVSVHQEALALFDHEGVDVADSGTTPGSAN